MLAAKTPPDGFKYRFPVLASPKLDGIRAIVRNGQLVSRSLKLIPNLHTQKLFGRPELEGLDGELIVGDATGRDANGDDVMQRTTSGVMRIEGEPDVTFWVFDSVSAVHFSGRLHNASLIAEGQPRVRTVPHVTISNQEELDCYEAACLGREFEGAMVRAPDGAYKQGRSTAKEGGLIKLKRFEDGEAWVVGFEERMHNGNEATTDELGHTKRSSHKENLVGRGDLGALVCHLLDPEGGRVKVLDSKGMYVNVEFNIGTGFTDAQRADIWARREELDGATVKFKSFTAAGVKVAPRFPVFVGWRHQDDM